MKRYLLVTLVMIAPLYGLSKATEELVKSMVPHGEVTQGFAKEYTVKTPAGTKITVEFDRAGKFDEASGLNLGKGDVFEPGDGLLTLGSVAKKLNEKGHFIVGEWRIEKDSKLGWIYELSGLQDEENINYVVDARTAQLISSEE